MSNQPLFIILLCTSSLTILVHGYCKNNFNCEYSSGYVRCCIYNECVYKSYGDSCSNYYGAHCVGDFDCTNGCCTDSSTCEPKSDARCIAKKNRCSGNWDCDSNCCKHKQCQRNNSLCTVDNDTGFHNHEINQDGWCGAGSNAACIGFMVGPILGFFIFICPLFVCLARRRRRRLRALLASGRIGVVIPALVVAPIIVDDEVQNEHERIANNPTCNEPPPSYEE